MGASRPWQASSPACRCNASKTYRMHPMDGINLMNITKRFLAAGLAVLLTFQWAAAQNVKFTDHKLKNGLRVILSEDHSAPTYSISVTYNVGSRDERPG